MAPVYSSVPRSPGTRQARVDGALNTIMEDIHDLRTAYSGHQVHLNVTTKRTHDWNEYDTTPNNFASKKYVPTRRSKHGSSPLAQHGDGHRFSLSSSRRASCATECRSRHRPDFDEWFDATDESDRESCPSLSSQGETRSNSSFTASDTSNSRSGRRRSFPVLSIPCSNFDPPMKLSPVPPTPPPKIPISASSLAKLHHTVPVAAVPPSLAGSTSAASDRPSTFSAPQTPDLGDVPEVNWEAQHLRVRGDAESANGSEAEPASAAMSLQLDIQLDSPTDWSAVLGNFPVIPSREVPEQPPSDCESDHPPSVASSKGVQLPVAAMATLQHFDVYSERQSSTPSVSEASEEMHEFPSHMRPKSTGDFMPPSASSGTSFTSLSVPSPGGFFASLKGQARKTWCFPNSRTPTSAMAERFYNLPWKDTIVEQIVECNDVSVDGPPTAKPLPPLPQTARRIPAEHPKVQPSPSRRNSDEYDASYAQALKARALSNLDRTTVWLAMQSTYPETADEGPAVNVEESPNLSSTVTTEPFPPFTDSTGSPKVSETVSPAPHEPPSKPLPAKESTFYHGFQHVRRNSQTSDTFLHSNFRFEAVQAARLSMRNKHIDHVAGKYELSSPVRPPYRGPFAQAPRNSKLPQVLLEQAMFSNVEKEQDVLAQLHVSTWAIEALKFLNGGPLVPSPAAKRLERAVPKDSPNFGKRRVRVLDLGGQTAGGWAWHLANEYPGVKVYTAVTKNQSASPVDGPSNHQHISVPELWRLPFKNNQFDLISARSLHMLLKSCRPRGVDSAPSDEMDMCLRECFRCLKPGGYLEFFLMDSEIVRAGTYGSATSVEFGFNLKTRGYDPAPTKAFLSRLRKSNFGDIKRAWLFLPMGTPYNEDSRIPGVSSPSSPSPAELTGSTADIASTAGIFGGWMWEQWMFRLQMEMGRDRGKLLEETAAVVEEGRKCGAGWRCLSGWAMKPRQKRAP